MADPLSMAAGIAGLLSLSLQLTKVISDYTITVSGASKAIGDLQDRLQALSQVLRQLNALLRTANVQGNSFDQSSVLCYAINACQEKLHRLGERLDQVTSKNGLSRVINSLKWPFVDNENKELLRNLDGYIEIFHFSVTIDGW
jgi:uncharacterized phage infection (PIP) family protein YhgE